MSNPMITNTFYVFEEHELNVLQRVFREAKFCTEADDTEITDSPIVATLYQRLITTLIEHDKKKYGEKDVERWNTWLNTMDETRAEWDATLKRILVHPKWLTFTNSEQLELIKTMFLPFVLSEEKLSYFIHLVNQKINTK